MFRPKESIEKQREIILSEADSRLELKITALKWLQIIEFKAQKRMENSKQSSHLWEIVV